MSEKLPLPEKEKLEKIQEIIKRSSQFIVLCGPSGSASLSKIEMIRIIPLLKNLPCHDRQ